MALQGLITQNIPGSAQNIVFSNPAVLDSITYASSLITYPISASFVLSQSDFLLFIKYETQFYNILLNNFPTIVSNINQKVDFAEIRIDATDSPDKIQFVQTSTAAPIFRIYNITFDRVAKTATFATRSHAISIPPQEYLLAFPILTLFANQVAIV